MCIHESLTLQHKQVYNTAETWLRPSWTQGLRTSSRL